MAYLNLFASVPETDIERFRADTSKLLRPSRILGASHLLAYWVEMQPLGGLLREAIDGGEVIHVDLSHPLRPPLFHFSSKVQVLTQQIAAAWEEVLVLHPPINDFWLTSEVGRLLQLLRHAADRGEGVVSALEGPAGHERARHIRPLWVAP